MEHISTDSTRHAACPHRSGFWKVLQDRLALQRQRRVLGQLGPDALRDLGLTGPQAQAESQRKIWDAPRHWIR
ncbi:DUF1127 domain-containing protein [Pseudorhodobacter sp. W20_MBD10_FR17]|uniref:DUF1127 domain-containing protein n=1 Tax=Pseudorhodobacter sp. W20_MBD10_FR17 TaxID=3240266 RepID=UPI003F97F0F4